MHWRIGLQKRHFLVSKDFVDQNGSSTQSPILSYEVLKTEHRKDIVEEIEWERRCGFMATNFKK